MGEKTPLVVAGIIAVILIITAASYLYTKSAWVDGLVRVYPITAKEQSNVGMGERYSLLGNSVWSFLLVELQTE